jgi:hypothetical protein
MPTDCTVRIWLSQKTAELRGFIAQTDEPEVIAELQRIRDELAACRRRHEDRCADCAPRPTHEAYCESDSEPLSGIELGDVVRFNSAPPAPSRREATRCSRH